MAEWFEGMPAVTSEIECQGSTHRILWQSGTLVALDHEHAEAEHLFAVLGGARTACEEVIETWRRHASDARLLAVGPRDVDDNPSLRLEEMMALREQSPVRSMVRVARAASGPLPHLVDPFAGSTLHTPEGRVDTRHFEVLRLFCLPRPFIDRLMLEVAWSISVGEAQGGSTGIGAVAAAAVTSRARRAVATWWSASSGEILLPRDVTAELARDAPAGPALLEIAERDNRVALRCRVEWLAALWGRGLALVDGYLATELIDVGDDRAVVRALRPAPSSEPHPRTIELERSGPAGRWTVTSR